MFVLIGSDDLHLTDYGPYIDFNDQEFNVTQNQGDQLDTAQFTIRDRMQSFTITDEMECIILDNSGAGAPQVWTGAAGFVFSYANLIANPSFEGTFSSSAPPSWTIIGALPTSMTIAANTSFAPLGSQSMAFAYTNRTGTTTGEGVFQIVTLNGGSAAPTTNPYCISIHSMMDQGFDSNTHGWTINVIWQDGSHSTLRTDSFGYPADTIANTADGAWNRYSLFLTAPAGAIYARIEIKTAWSNGGGPNTGTCYFDGIQLEYCSQYTASMGGSGPLAAPQPPLGSGFGQMLCHGTDDGFGDTLCDGWTYGRFPASSIVQTVVTSPALHGTAQKIHLPNNSGMGTAHPSVVGITIGNDYSRLDYEFDGLFTAGSYLPDIEADVQNYAWTLTIQYQVSAALSANLAAGIRVDALYGNDSSTVSTFTGLGIAQGTLGEGISSGWKTLSLTFGKGTSNPAPGFATGNTGLIITVGLYYTDTGACSGDIIIGEVDLVLAASQPLGAPVQTPQSAGLYPSPFTIGSGTTSYGTNPLQTLPRLFGGFVKDCKRAYQGPERLYQLQCTEYGILMQEAVFTLAVLNQTDQAGIQAICQAAQNNGYLQGVDFSSHVSAIGNIDSLYFSIETIRNAMNLIAGQTQAAFYMDYFRALWYGIPLAVAAPFGLSDNPDGISTYAFTDPVFEDDGTNSLTEKIVEGQQGISGPITETQSGTGSQTSFYVNGSTSIFSFPIAQMDSIVVGNTILKLGVLGTNTLNAAPDFYQALYDAQTCQVQFETAPPSGTQNIAFTYRLQAPPLVKIAIAAAEMPGGSVGRKIAHHQVYSAITSKQSAIDRANAETALYQKALKCGTLSLWQRADLPAGDADNIPGGSGLRPGMALPITFAPESLVAQQFQIQQIVIRIRGLVIQRDLTIGFYRPDSVIMQAQAARDQAITGGTATGDAVLDDIQTLTDGWTMGDSIGTPMAHFVGLWGSVSGEGTWGNNPAYIVPPGPLQTPAPQLDRGLGAEQLTVSGASAATAIGINDFASGSDAAISPLAWGA